MSRKSKYAHITKELLEQEFAKGKSALQIEREQGMPQGTLPNHMKKLGVVNPNSRKVAKKAAGQLQQYEQEIKKYNQEMDEQVQEIDRLHEQLTKKEQLCEERGKEIMRLQRKLIEMNAELESKTWMLDEAKEKAISDTVIVGVGKDAPIVTNEKGGKQSETLYRFDLVDPRAMFEMTKVLKEGFDKYGDDENWRRIPVHDHLNHLLIHAYAYLAGDQSDEHLSHIMCRAMFAQAVDITGGRNEERSV